MKRITSLACAALASLSIASAQNESNPWAIGVYGGLTEYEGELASDMFGILGKGYTFHGHGGLQVSRFLNQRWDVSLFGAYGRIGAKFNKSVAPLSNGPVYKQNEIYADLTAAFKFVKNEKCKFHPFAFAGIGYRNLSTVEDFIGVDGGDLVIPAGLGCDLRLSERVALSYICRYGFTLGDDKDTRDCGKVNDQQMMHSLGVKFAFGAPKDSDKDGVEDKLDECPNTPAGVAVDSKGCPLDDDKDGVPNYLDKCPGTPAGVQVDSLGCPIDSDGDGVADYLDKCPNTPAAAKGMIDENGCPLDSDGDGVADYLDQCPGTPAAAKGFVDEKGCPLDSDGDGIYDYEDACPNEKGVKENNGCPEVKEAVKQLFKKALNGIQFETGKATIKKTSYKILDDVVNVMNENPTYKLFIGGHTDNVGNADKNLKLSDDRAAAVKAYLVNHGVDEARMKSKGFGQEKPVADNKTAKGRAENRRVEFRVVFEKVVEEAISVRPVEE